MTSDLDESKSHWEKRYRSLNNWQVLKTELLHGEALAWESHYAEKHGCLSGAGGRRLIGRVYSVYKFSY